MPTNSELRELLGLPRNTKTRQILNHAIRATQGGAELLQRLERVDARLYWARAEDTPEAAAQLQRDRDALVDQRDKLADDIRIGRVRLPQIGADHGRQ